MIWNIKFGDTRRYLFCHIDLLFLSCSSWALHTAMIMGIFRGENLGSHDSAYYPLTIKFNLLHRGPCPKEKVCNRAWSPFFILVEPLSFGTVVFPLQDFSHKSSSACIVYLCLQNPIINWVWVNSPEKYTPTYTNIGTYTHIVHIHI